MNIRNAVLFSVFVGLFSVAVQASENSLFLGIYNVDENCSEKDIKEQQSSKVEICCHSWDNYKRRLATFWAKVQKKTMEDFLVDPRRKSLKIRWDGKREWIHEAKKIYELSKKFSFCLKNKEKREKELEELYTKRKEELLRYSSLKKAILSKKLNDTMLELKDDDLYIKKQKIEKVTCEISSNEKYYRRLNIDNERYKKRRLEDIKEKRHFYYDNIISFNKILMLVDPFTSLFNDSTPYICVNKNLFTFSIVGKFPIGESLLKQEFPEKFKNCCPDPSMFDILPDPSIIKKRDTLNRIVVRQSCEKPKQESSGWCSIQ